MFQPILGRAECGDFATIVRKEWLVTNGLGGFASSSVTDLHTRRYHGLLVAALRPPLDRTLLLSKLDATAYYGSKAFPLFANEFSDSTVDPTGYHHLESFQLQGLTPTWVYRLSDAWLEKTVWMEYGQNTTYIRYNLKQATQAVTLILIPLCTYRGYHSHSQGGWTLGVTPTLNGFTVHAFAGAQPYHLVATRGNFQLGPAWYWGFHHRTEQYRGLDSREDLLAAGQFRVMLEPGQDVTFTCSTEISTPQDGATAYERERQRQMALIANQSASQADCLSNLVLAADQFIVQRHRPTASNGENTTPGKTIIAGYPWFGDWGRDTMIALPGLTLATGRPDVAADILQTFAQFVDQGLLPNRFPDDAETPNYNTADATLWYFHALYQYVRYTDQLDLVEALYPLLNEIIDWHQRGTHYNIHVDSADGLLFAGEAGVQLTWMDAKIGDWVVTPRIGKPVEINALWYNALRIMALFSEKLGQAQAVQKYTDLADTVAENFQRRFWFEAGGYLYDVIDGPEGNLGLDGKRADSSLRPNQILAVSLPFPLVTEAQAKAVVDTVGQHLFTSHGLRTLATDYAAYRGVYGGGQTERDGAYHQGTAWAWLLGPFALAHYRVYNNVAQAKATLAGLTTHLSDGGFGSLSEIFDGDPPHPPRGCFAQAWSVGEILWAWHTLHQMETTHDHNG